ncbi:MAG: restriction endonuclease subunit S [Lachnospiraceae bacterium]|nr:restriction endonuclease subunit S [Lachnospiraceae bacterium]
MANTPNIRFKGFHDEWEQRKFGEVFEEYSEKNHLELSPLTIIQGVGTILREYSNRNLQYDKSSLSGYKMVRRNDFIVHLRSFEGGLEKANSDGIISPAYHTFHGIETDSRFYYPFFRSKYFIDVLLKPHVYGIRDGKSIDIDGMKTIMIPVPSYEEQKKVGGYIDNLDHLITLHQRKCDEVKQLKKFMLQKMFPKSGELVPEIRFAGFTGDWEQRKLGDITNILSASRVHKEEWKTEGVPFFRSSDVMAAFKGTKNDKVFISQELFEKLSAISGKPQQGDIFITGGGSIGTPYIVPNNEPLYSKDADLIWVKKSEKHDSFYLYSYFVSPIFREYLLSISHTGTIAHYTIEQVKKTPVFFPSLEEQQKIGVYFSNLDHLITLHQHKCDELQGVKKFMLQNMFVQKHKN